MKLNSILEDLLNFCSSRGLSGVTVSEFQYSGADFGNAKIILELKNVRLKIVLDRGQTFLDVWSDQTKSFDNAENIFPALRELQEKGNWRLFDQLSLIFV